jgi:hypothetical protein
VVLVVWVARLLQQILMVVLAASVALVDPVVQLRELVYR